MKNYVPGWEAEILKCYIFVSNQQVSYGEALSYYLIDKGFIVSVVNPAQIKSFAQSELSRNKTDKADWRATKAAFLVGESPTLAIGLFGQVARSAFIRSNSYR